MHGTRSFPRCCGFFRFHIQLRSYGDLEGKGATVVWGDFSEGVGKLIPAGESFDYVFDNYAKDVATCEDLAQSAKSWCASLEQQLFL